MESTQLFYNSRFFLFEKEVLPHHNAAKQNIEDCSKTSIFILGLMTLTSSFLEEDAGNISSH